MGGTRNARERKKKAISRIPVPFEQSAAHGSIQSSVGKGQHHRRGPANATIRFMLQGQWNLQASRKLGGNRNEGDHAACSEWITPMRGAILASSQTNPRGIEATRTAEDDQGHGNQSGVTCGTRSAAQLFGGGHPISGGTQLKISPDLLVQRCPQSPHIVAAIVHLILRRSEHCRPMMKVMAPGAPDDAARDYLEQTVKSILLTEHWHD